MITVLIFILIIIMLIAPLILLNSRLKQREKTLERAMDYLIETKDSPLDELKKEYAKSTQTEGAEQRVEISFWRSIRRNFPGYVYSSKQELIEHEQMKFKNNRNAIE